MSAVQWGDHAKDSCLVRTGTEVVCAVCGATFGQCDSPRGACDGKSWRVRALFAGPWREVTDAGLDRELGR